MATRQTPGAPTAVDPSSKESIARAQSAQSLPIVRCPPSSDITVDHQLFSSRYIAAGLSRYPTTPGQTTAVIKSAVPLFSLPRTEFVQTLCDVAIVASLLCEHYEVERCALVTEGDTSISLLPLHHTINDDNDDNDDNEDNDDNDDNSDDNDDNDNNDNNKDIHKTTITLKWEEYHESYPGYISSVGGPLMPFEKTGAICGKIQTLSGLRWLQGPFNHRFDGPDRKDDHPYARLIRGEVNQPRFRVWEDDKHVAFLDMYPNTPGVTVVVPRRNHYYRRQRHSSSASAGGGVLGLLDEYFYDVDLSQDVSSLDLDVDAFYQLFDSEYCSSRARNALSLLMEAAHQVAGHLMEAFRTDRCGMIFGEPPALGCREYPHISLIPIVKDNRDGPDQSCKERSELSTVFQEAYPGYVSSLKGPLLGDGDIESLQRDADEIRYRYNERYKKAVAEVVVPDELRAMNLELESLGIKA